MDGDNISYKVTVIIPTFNAEKYIERTVDSVINQTIDFENIELIIIDDNSTDNTKQILKNFQAQYENVKPIFLKENSGTPSKPRNIGIKNTTTNYIMFLDQDDEYTPEMCEKMYSTITKDDVDIVMCRYNIISKDNTKMHNNPLFKRVENISIVKPELLPLLYRAFPQVWINIYKKDMIINNYIKFPDYLLAEDFYFNLQYYCKIRKVKILPCFIGYKYYLHDNNTSNSFSYADNEKNQESFKKLYETYKLMLQFIDNQDKNLYPIKNSLIASLTMYFLTNNLSNKCMDKYLYEINPHLKKYKLFTRIPYSNLFLNVGLNIIIKTPYLIKKVTIKTLKKTLWVLKIRF
ncbi:MAG: glycosyltransferase family 2 protein [Methanobrevibacter sp.]|jgi:glycosyltransferase involved in cell wall biosynthesis|nr:glycosyltransferase family 2 protein [Candidatus Methanovirga australis]